MVQRAPLGFILLGGLLHVLEPLPRAQGLVGSRGGRTHAWSTLSSSCGVSVSLRRHLHREPLPQRCPCSEPCSSRKQGCSELVNPVIFCFSS